MAKTTNPITIKGKSVTANGVLNVENMTLEVEEFSEPVSIQQILAKQGLDGKLVKVTFVEPDMPITESDLEVE